MITQRVRVVIGSTTYIPFRDDVYFNSLELYELTILPAWINIIPLTEPYIELLEIIPPTLGTYSYDFTLGGSPSNPDARLVVEVVDSLTTSLTTCNNSNAITLVWITREGGRASYIFDQRKDFSLDTGENKTFDNGGVLKYFERGKNLDVKTVYKTGLSNAEIDLIASLRTSIQAWEYDYVTDISTPILVNPDSFDLYSTKVNLNEITLRYSVAKYKIIQSQ